jgi:hypothetical protein
MLAMIRTKVLTTNRLVVRTSVLTNQYLDQSIEELKPGRLGDTGKQFPGICQPLRQRPDRV